MSKARVSEGEGVGEHGYRPQDISFEKGEPWFRAACACGWHGEWRAKSVYAEDDRRQHEADTREVAAEERRRMDAASEEER